eukprot:SAG11_NODE_34438_length_272_cov_0.589595_1_plen_71_part_10
MLRLGVYEGVACSEIYICFDLNSEKMVFFASPRFVTHWALFLYKEHIACPLALLYHVIVHLEQARDLCHFC